MQRGFEVFGRGIIVLGILLAVTGPFWIGGPVELHGWDGRSPFALAAGLVLAVLGWIVVKIFRGGSTTQRVALSLGAALLAFVFMIPAAYSVACGDRQLGRGSGCETQAFSNIAGVPVPEFNWFLTTTVVFLSASVVWAAMGCRNSKAPRA